MVTVKVVKQSDLNKRELGQQNLQSEIVAHLSIPCNNIIEIRDIFYHKQNYILVYEMIASSSLNKIILSKHKEYSTEFCQFVLFSVCKAIKALHYSRCAHRDIKSQNIHFDQNGTVKLSDLSSCGFITDEKGLLEQAIGTPGFMAPEIYEQNPRYN